MPTETSRQQTHPRAVSLTSSVLWGIWWRGRDAYDGGAAPPESLEIEIASHHAAERLEFHDNTLEEFRRFPEDGYANEKQAAEEGAALTVKSGACVYRQAGEYRNAPWRNEMGKQALFRGPSSHAEAPGLIVRSVTNDGVLSATTEVAEIAFLDTADTQPELSLDGCHLAVAAGSPVSWHIHAVAGS